MLHARATSDARNRPQTAPRAPRRHTRRPRAEHSRADFERNRFAPHPMIPAPLNRSRLMRQRVSGLLIDSKNCSRKALPKGEQSVSEREALTARDKEATLWPHRAG